MLYGGYDYELRPIVKKIEKVTVIETSENSSHSDIDGIPLRYVKPKSDGFLIFESNSFDLIICIDVSHHVANVTKVINEFYRCQKPGGYSVIREPIKSLGDWSKPRKGLTKNERGIPLHIFRQIILRAGFEIIKESKCRHTITKLIQNFCDKYFAAKSVYNSIIAMKLDRLFSKYLDINRQYHPIKRRRGPCATSVVYVLFK
jgi:SAM-dependent methyltransferase